MLTVNWGCCLRYHLSELWGCCLLGYHLSELEVLSGYHLSELGVLSAQVSPQWWYYNSVIFFEM